MITARSHTGSWIFPLKAKLGKKADAKLIEKVVRALTFLEQLQVNGLKFIFKGGTALLLATKEPRRFSIDIDIITLQSGAHIEAILKKIVEDGHFIRMEDDNSRKHTPDAPIGHYKVFYDSVVDGREEPILLDLLYTLNPYPQLRQVPIEHDWLDTTGKITAVEMPTFDAILGDKLTAFAPKTTGILYVKERPVEIIKQLYDIDFLFDNITSLDVVRESYDKVVQEEIGFRKLKIDALGVMDDTHEACFLLARRDDKDYNYKHLSKGISNFINFTLAPFRIEEAIVAAAKVAYLMELLKDGTATVVERYGNAAQIVDWTVENQEYNKVNKLKKTNPEAFYYWYRTLEKSNSLKNA